MGKYSVVNMARMLLAFFVIITSAFEAIASKPTERNCAMVLDVKHITVLQFDPKPARPRNGRPRVEDTTGAKDADLKPKSYLVGSIQFFTDGRAAVRTPLDPARAAADILDRNDAFEFSAQRFDAKTRREMSSLDLCRGSKRLGCQLRCMGGQNQTDHPKHSNDQRDNHLELLERQCNTCNFVFKTNLSYGGRLVTQIAVAYVPWVLAMTLIPIGLIWFGLNLTRSFRRQAVGVAIACAGFGCMALFLILNYT